MRPFSYHVHTQFCDGKNTAEEMVLAAIDANFDSIGFSSHSHVRKSGDIFGMKKENLSLYRNEVLRLADAYKDKISVFLGIEQDSFSALEDIPYGCRFVIGSVHYVPTESGEYISVDHSADILRRGVETHFGGDYMAYSEAYYKEVEKVYDKTVCDIVGHLDLLTKFNEKCPLIDESNPRYLRAAFSAAESLARKGLTFEINSGAIGRGYRTTPYPTEEILNVIRESGGKITYSSDCHKAEFIACGFDEALALAKKCGFKSFMKLGEKGFYEEEL